MKTILLAAAGAAIGAAAAATLRTERQSHQKTSARLAKARQRLATTLDSLREAQQANRHLQAEVAECNATIACMQADHERQNIAILNLIKRLNAANVRCAEMQGTLDSRGVTVNTAYFLAALSDGSIAGPFSRN